MSVSHCPQPPRKNRQRILFSLGLPHCSYCLQIQRDQGEGRLSYRKDSKMGKKKRTGEIIIEEKYTKQGLYESILERPTLYIGSVEPVTEWMWVYNEDKEQMEKREIKYSPGLLKIFDEILVNASDR